MQVCSFHLIQLPTVSLIYNTSSRMSLYAVCFCAKNIYLLELTVMQLIQLNWIFFLPVLTSFGVALTAFQRGIATSLIPA